MLKKMISKNGLIVFAALSLASFSAFSQTSSTPPETVKRVLEGHNLPSGSYSFKVQELGSNEALLAVNSSAMLNPASSIKAITTLVGLEKLGPNYRWQTDVYTSGNIENGTLHGDLIIKGGGDPFLVEDKFRNLLKTLQRRGIERITGNLILDHGAFNIKNRDPGSFDGQGSRSYNVIPNAVLVNFQALTFYFYPHPNGKDVIIKTNPELNNLTIENRLSSISGGCGGFQRGIAFDKSATDSNTVIFSGRYPSSCGEYSLTRSVLDAPNYTFGLFTQLWEEIGGEFNGELITSNIVIDEENRPFLRWFSEPLSDIITSINKFSNNVMVRHLLLTLAFEDSDEPATVENGIKVVEEYLLERGIDQEQIKMINGAGLSRDVRLSTDLMVEVLEQAVSTPFAAEYISSLPLGGIDGTMRSRLRGRAAAGNMHIKTGSLSGASAVAGYVNAKSGKQYAVVGILNHKLAHRGPGTELMNALLQWVYEQ